MGIQQHLYTTLIHRDKNRKSGVTIFKYMHILLIPGLYLKAIPTPNLQRCYIKVLIAAILKESMYSPFRVDSYMQWIHSTNRQQLDSDYMYPQPLRA